MSRIMDNGELQIAHGRQGPTLDEYDLVIVGAGLASLCLAQRLAALPQRMLVIDETAAWLESWWSGIGRQRHKRLHSLPSHSPHQNASALPSFQAKQDGNNIHSLEVCPAQFYQFCHQNIIAHLPKTLQDVLAAKVTSISLAVQDTGACDIEISTGQKLRAGSVVLASAHSIPAMPQWLDKLFASPQDQQDVMLLHESKVDLNGDVKAKSIAVMSGKGHAAQAAHLACCAAESGAAAVLLVLQEDLTEAVLPMEIGWYGAKNMQVFRSMKDTRRRLHVCRQAWEKSRVPLGTTAALAEQDQIVMIRLEAVHHIASLPDGRSSIVYLTPNQCSGTSMPRTSGLTAPDERQTTTGHAQSGGTTAMPVDMIWAATGMAVSAMEDPLLAQLQQAAPTRVVGGYCVVDDDTLVWPGAGVHLLGRCASLSIGPTAGELAGMRTAADRVAAWLTTKWHKRKLPDVMPWQACAEALAQDRGLVDPDVPLDGYGSVPLDAGSKISIFKPVDRVDITDLPQSLSRREIQGFTWTDNDFEICITCPLLEPVSRNHVRVMYTSRAVEVWAVGKTAAYHLYLPKLYQPIVAERCTFKANTKRQKIYLLLQKQADAEWRFLKG